MTVCNMSIEAGARAGLIAPDAVTFEYLAHTPRAPQGDDFARAVARWRQLRSDEGAHFDRKVRINASEVRPTITWGTHPVQVAATATGVPAPQPRDRDGYDHALARDHMGWAGTTPLAGRSVDVVYVGLCTKEDRA